MKTHSIEEAESVTRSIARWGSVAAATIFAIAFLTDETRTWSVIFQPEAARIALIVGIFVGYALALTRRFEVLGSAIALLALCGVYVMSGAISDPVAAPAPIFLAVGAPALFHLAAVMLHRMVLLPRSTQKAGGG